MDGDGRGVHTDGHGSLLLLEKLSRVSWPLSDDGLRLLETQNKYRVLIFFLLNVLRPFLETLSFIILQTDLYLRFLLVQIEVLDARLCYLRRRIQWFICNTKQRETRSPVNKSVRRPETADKWAARSHQQGATQTVFVSTDTFYYLQSCTQRKVFRFYCATQTRIKMFGGQEPSGSWLGDILKSNTRLITRFKNWTRCHTN